MCDCTFTLQIVLLLIQWQPNALIDPGISGQIQLETISHLRWHKAPAQIVMLAGEEAGAQLRCGQANQHGRLYVAVGLAGIRIGSGFDVPATGNVDTAPNLNYKQIFLGRACLT